MIFKNWLDTRPKMETHDPNVYPTILGGVSRGFWTLFLDWGAVSAIFWHLKTDTFTKSVHWSVKYKVQWCIDNMIISIRYNLQLRTGGEHIIRHLLYTEKLLYNFFNSSHDSSPCPAKLENRVMVPKMSVMIFITGAALLLSKQRKRTLCK